MIALLFVLFFLGLFAGGFALIRFSQRAFPFDHAHEIRQQSRPAIGVHGGEGGDTVECTADHKSAAFPLAVKNSHAVDWHPRPPCVAIVQGGCRLVEFADGKRYVITRNALRRAAL